jgi:glycosyltransferase involved in cell wall biosynthesis/predicted O-methyltransferase YrrM
VTKLNHYTDGEAENLLADGASHSWQAQMAHFVGDWQAYYDREKGHLDGMHGFVLSFLSGVYRWLARAKLWDLRRRRGELLGPDPVPGSVDEMLDFMGRVAREGAASWLAEGYPRQSARGGEVPAEWYGAHVVAWNGGTQADSLRHAGAQADGGGEERTQADGGEDEGTQADSLRHRERGKTGITACIMARNEGRRIGAALQSLQGWTDEILVIDNESEDDTAAVARRYADLVLSAPRTLQFDGLRNLAIEHATGDWLFYLDADERVGPRLGPVLRRLVRERGAEFDGLCVPFKNVFYGKWMQSRVWWPGYAGPRLLKKGAFQYGERFHVGAVVSGRLLHLPGEDPELAITHQAYDDLGHYLDKLNRYTSGEAENMLGEGASHSWQAQLGEFVHDWRVHYDDGRAYVDGMHGFVQSLLCAFYRFVTRAKLWDLRRQGSDGAREGEGEGAREEGVPASLQEMLEFMRRVRPGRQPRALPIAEPPVPVKESIPAQSDAILVQCASGDQVRLLELTRRRHEEYARAHGMDYLCRCGPRQSERHPCWDKIPLILEVLRDGKHDQIFWLDADTMIVDRTRDLRAALPADAWLGMVHHGEPPYFNNGVMYIRNTPMSRAFFEELWRTWPVPEGWLDNETLIALLRRDAAKWPGVCLLPDEWNSTIHQNECRRPVVRAWHGYGDAAARYVSMELCLEDVIFKEKRDAARQRSAAAPAVRASDRPGLVRPNANPAPLDPVPAVDFREELGRPLRVRWEGDQLLWSSLALVNRELCLGMLAAGDVELTSPQIPHPWHRLSERDDERFGRLFERINAPLSGPPDVTVRHHFPANWERPAEGKLVVMQPWELSHLPREDWIEGARRHADEVWAYSRFVRDIYVRSGVPAERVRIVPLGVRIEVFEPEGTRYALPTKKSIRFLFVGGAIPRKGIDLLLEAYRRAFTAADDVCLIVKDMGTRTFYEGQTLAAAVRAAQADTSGPEVLYMDRDLSEPDMAALYRACTCVVLPYRGEGFGLTPLEGMACGRLVIVTSGGPTDDYVDDFVALRLPHRRVVRAGLYRGEQACAWDPWELEPDFDALVSALRWARDHPEEARRRGEEARARAAAGWTWERAAGVARERVLRVVAPSVSGGQRAKGVQVFRCSGVQGTTNDERPTTNEAFAGHLNTRTPEHLNTETPVLSLCMIVRDEEARIGACLGSIAPFVDEMVVVDTGSEDRTKEIALACGARVFEFPWVDSFAAARNASLEAARGEWIFWMDADDVMSAECGAQLREIIRRHPRRDAACQVQVRIPPGPGEFSPSVVDHVKLFPNRPDLRFEHRIHEQILPALRRAGIEVHFSDLYVTHAHYDRSEEGQVKKRRRDFRLLELDLVDLPDHPFVLFNLGMTYLYATKEYEVAAHYLQRSLERSDWRDSIVRKAYAMLATARLCQGEWEAAVAANEQGREHYPDDAELLFQAGQIYQQVERLPEAQRALERLLAGEDGPHYRSVDTALRTYRGRHELALLLRRTGDAAQCERLLKEIVEAHPEYLPAQADLAEMYQAQGRGTAARGNERASGRAGERATTAAPGLGLLTVAGNETLATQLAVAHQEWEAMVGVPGMAVSRELALYLWSLLEERRPRRVLDLGSGFSSYVFRLFAATQGGEMTLWTADHDGEWLAKTRRFLQCHDLSVANMITWEAFDESEFDLVLHDLGGMEMRAATVEKALRLARPGGAVVLDDANRSEYAAHVVGVLQRLGLRYQSLAHATTDGYGRHSWLVIRG